MDEIATTFNTDVDWLLLVPPFDLQKTMTDMKLNSDIRQVCRTMKEEIGATIECEIQPFFGWEKPGVLRHMLCFVISSILLFSVLIVKESHFMSIMRDSIHQREAPERAEDDYLDEDVEHEKEIVDGLLPSEIAEKRLVLNRLTKFYCKFLAVNEISLIVGHSECFGLLGMNGAGKTSTFKMLIGDENISSGQGYVNGLSLRTNMHEVYNEIGYCPQFDALLDDLTGRETLRMYCLIHGIPRKQISVLSKELAIGFGFVKYYNKPVHSYSGGNKRKLSAAIALIGNPSLIYLDEPTTGMDPAARRRLWNVMCKFRDSGKSIVLTSHNMDECEALCTRIAIMVNGELKCLGSIQHLKNTFTKGLTLKIKIHQDSNLTRRSVQKKPSQKPNQETKSEVHDTKADIDRVKQFVQHEFPESQLKEEKQGLLSFNIPHTKITWSQIFGLMEANKDALNIEDYSITQASLEDIFLQFAEKQHDDQRAYL